MTEFAALLFSTAVTVFGESAVFFRFGFRSRADQLRLLYANGVTFPLFRFCLFLGATAGWRFELFDILLAELLIVGVEFTLLSFGSQRKDVFRLGAAVLCANTTSFFFGEALLWG